ncbi:bacterio-opsin activator [Halorubrum sp. SD626R]|uniref:helix-turn-helix domain-containing protein n=1 Tax=Halorubrum TaxID=56688 RepID=UPI0010F9415F|nr:MULTISPECIES: helix-turn-helix domain-containing protein [Halorubrum]TKX78552.1 bacterio-opsin activator [Halorubrum sp. SD626R]
MKYARLRVHHTAETRHPMHAFEMAHDRIDSAELRHWNTVLDETNTFVFRVRGDPDPFRAKLESRPSTVEYSLTPVSDGVFHCCVRERATETDEEFIGAVARGSLVVLPPIRFNPDGTTDLTVAGPAADVSAAVESLPDGMRASVRSVGPYHRRAGPAASRLTDRQRSVVAAAVERGYYDSPRACTVSDVAAEFDIAPGTAAEHLRKAEAAVMRHALDRA